MLLNIKYIPIDWNWLPGRSIPFIKQKIHHREGALLLEDLVALESCCPQGFLAPGRLLESAPALWFHGPVGAEH